MSPARKKRIWEAWGGKCWMCRMPVPMEGSGVVYDHVTPLFLKGSDADEDIGPIHSETCNKLKTSADLTRIAKTKRQAKKLGQDAQPREPSRIPSRGFERPRIKKPWPKRSFPKRPVD